MNVEHKARVSEAYKLEYRASTIAQSLITFQYLPRPCQHNRISSRLNIMDSPTEKNDAATAKKTDEEEKAGRRTSMKASKAGRRSSMQAAEAIEDELEKIMNGG